MEEAGTKDRCQAIPEGLNEDFRCERELGHDGPHSCITEEGQSRWIDTPPLNPEPDNS